MIKHILYQFTINKKEKMNCSNSWILYHAYIEKIM